MEISHPTKIMKRYSYMMATTLKKRISLKPYEINGLERFILLHTTFHIQKLHSPMVATNFFS
jgi:hypothetical protein